MQERETDSDAPATAMEQQRSQLRELEANTDWLEAFKERLEASRKRLEASKKRLEASTQWMEASTRQLGTPPHNLQRGYKDIAAQASRVERIQREISPLLHGGERASMSLRGRRWLAGATLSPSLP